MKNKSELKPTVGSKSEQTKARILNAAIQIISTQGIENATTREIAKVAHVAKGLVSHYIKRQDDLFDMVIQEISNQAYHLIESPPGAESGENKIVFMCRANFEFFLRHSDYMKCFLLFYYFSSISQDLQKRNDILVETARKRLQTYWKQNLSEHEVYQSEDQIQYAVELIHNHLFGSLLKLYSTSQNRKGDEIIEDFLDSVRFLIEKLRTR